jgi:hypothetical protein
MSILTAFFLLWSLAVIPIVLLGLLVRRSYRQCLSFLLYLTLVWLGDLLLVAWPMTFQTWAFWTVKETIYLAIKLIMTLELARRMLRAFPGALALAELTIFIACTGLLGVLLLNWPSRPWDLGWVWISLGSWAQNGAAGLFLLLWALVIWYRIPIHPLHRGVMRGFSFYLLTNAILLGAYERNPGVTTLSILGTGVPWMLLVTYWSWVAWRLPPAMDPTGRAVVRIPIGRAI